MESRSEHKHLSESVEVSGEFHRALLRLHRISVPGGWIYLIDERPVYVPAPPVTASEARSEPSESLVLRECDYCGARSWSGIYPPGTVVHCYACGVAQQVGSDEEGKA